jgi:hypothetical protein
VGALLAGEPVRAVLDGARFKEVAARHPELMDTLEAQFL